MNKRIVLIVLLSFTGIVFTSNELLAQCAISDPVPQQGCAGTVTFNATSMSTTVNHHVWYDQYFNTIAPTSEQKIEYSPGTGQVAWVSSLTVNLTSSKTYYVAASCNTNNKRAVTFTLNSVAVGFTMTPSANPNNLCAGQTILLSGNNGSSYEWRLNSPTATDYTTGSDRYVTSSGTYYLRGVNGCGTWVDGGSIPLNFKPAMTDVYLNGPGSVCQTTVTSQYTGGGTNVNAVSWSISDTDPNANATINGNGVVTWNGISTGATITMTAYGCGSTTVTRTQNVSIELPPNNLEIKTELYNFCRNGGAIFTVTGNNIYSVTWEGITNGTLSSTGWARWDEFDGTTTITANAHGCNGTITPVTKSVIIYPLPSISVTPPKDAVIPEGSSSITLTASSGDGYTYKWFKSKTGGFVIGTSQSYTATAADTYGVEVTDLHGCKSQSPSIRVSFENNHNYIIENTLQTDKHEDGSAITETEMRSLSVEERLEKTQYIDGLGQPMQVVSTQASPGKKDIVQPLFFDFLGKEYIKLLPVTMQSNGVFKTSIVSSPTTGYINEAKPFYAAGSDNMIADDSKPFAQTISDRSPLNRTIKQGAPGVVWQPGSGADATIKYSYEANLSQEVYLITYEMNTGSIHYSSGNVISYYEPNQLYKNKTIDEHNNESIEYIDIKGRIICKKVQSGVDGNNNKLYATTYYVYDDLDNLVVVLPPEAVKTITSN